MKLSELVRAIKYLNKININSLNDSLTNLIKDLDIVSTSVSVDHLKDLQNVLSVLEKINPIIAIAESEVLSIRHKLQSDIEERSAPYKVAGGAVDGMPNVEDLKVEEIRSLRPKVFTDDANYSILTSIRHHTSPMYPALEIGCGDGQWTKHMVAADPLYILDIYPEFTKSASSQFPIEYQRRLRPYTLGFDGIPADDMSILPQNQFGFILAVGVFDYHTLDRFHHYLKQVYGLLRPGGVAFFTYNNCEESVNVKLVESGFKSWATKTGIEDFCKEHNFEILNSITNTDISWMEIKKPGKLKTVKLEQALGKIHRKDD